jgi:Ser/Thr protein kinase RdoA (MazF antagonist)
MEEPNIHPPIESDSLERIAAEMADLLRHFGERMEDGRFRVLHGDARACKALVKRYGKVALQAAQENGEG